MKILVCIKAVTPMAGSLSGHSPTELMINPADLTALEEALMLKDTSGATVTVLTMGVPRCETLLRDSLARGADQAVLLTDPAFAGSDTAATSRILAEAVKLLGGYDLIFCGCRSTDGETGQVGPELAQRLGYACAVFCTYLAVSDPKVSCQCLDTAETVSYSLSFPALITFRNGINSPRLPSLTGLYQSRRKTIRTLHCSDLNLKPSSCGSAGSPTKVIQAVTRSFEKRSARKFNNSNLEAALTAIWEKISPEV